MEEGSLPSRPACSHWQDHSPISITAYFFRIPAHVENQPRQLSLMCCGISTECGLHSHSHKMKKKILSGTMVSQGPTAFSNVIASRAQRSPPLQSNRDPGSAEAERAVSHSRISPEAPRLLPFCGHRAHVLTVSWHPNAHPGHGVGLTFVHCRRNWATDTQGFIVLKGVTEVPQHGCPQALAAVLPPHKHGVKDRQQVACTGAVTTEAACRKASDLCYPVLCPCCVPPPPPPAAC